MTNYNISILEAVLITLFILNAFMTVAAIGQEQEPMTPGKAAFVVLFNMLFIVGLIFGW